MTKCTIEITTAGVTKELEISEELYFALEGGEPETETDPVEIVIRRFDEVTESEVAIQGVYL